jgi:REP element-mobilizing transposase RayT
MQFATGKYNRGIEMDHRPVRKKNRLENYDYSQPGYYFVTVCTEDRKLLLGTVTKSDAAHSSEVILSHAGVVTAEAIQAMSNVYQNVTVEKYVIMPNHFHMILSFHESEQPLPDLSRVVQQTKRRVSKILGMSIWQSHYFDRVIRGEADYRAVWEYIDNNPTKWSLDKYYNEG